MGRILAVDPGEKRLGIAISDPTGTIATPLTIVMHVSRVIDAAAIAQLAADQSVELIVIGEALDADGEKGSSARHAAKLAQAIETQTLIPVVLWDESESTNHAIEARREMGVVRKNRRGHLDEIAATIILQSYLESHRK